MGLWDTTNLLKNAYISDDTTITGDCSLRNLGKSILIGGLDANGTIIFNTPPTMSGANIATASIPITSVNGGGHSGLYVDLISNQDVGGVKNFTSNLRAHATSGDVFQAFKNGSGNSGHVLINGEGELSYYDSSASLSKWKIDSAGALTAGSITATSVSSGSFVANGSGNRLQIFTDSASTYWAYNSAGLYTSYRANNGKINYRCSPTTGDLETVGDITVYNGSYIPGIGSPVAPDVNRLVLGKSLIGYYNIATSLYNWSISNTGAAIFTGGLDASGTIIFRTAPTMSGANITTASIPETAIIGGSGIYVNLIGNQSVAGIKTFTSPPVMSGGSIATASIPESAIIGGSGIYVNLTSNQDVGGVKNFTSNLRAHATTGDVFQAFKNGSGNAGHVLVNSSGDLSYYDSTGLLSKWSLTSVGKATFSNGLDVTGTITLPNLSISDSALSNNIAKLDTNQTFSALKTFSNGLTVSAGTITLQNSSISDSALTNNIPLKNAYNSYSGTNSFSVSSGDAITVIKSSGGGYIFLNGGGSIGFWNGSAFNWSIDASGNAILYSLNVPSATITTSLQIGNNLYSPNNGKFSVCLGQNTPLSTQTSSVIIGYSAGTALNAAASLNVVIGAQALLANNNSGASQITAIGFQSLLKYTGAPGNTAIGAYAGSELVTGTANCFFGPASGGGLRVGCDYNFFMGTSAGGSCSGILAVAILYIYPNIVNQTIIELYAATTVDAFLSVVFRGANGLTYSSRVASVNQTTGQIILISAVHAGSLKYMYFYNGGELLVTSTYAGVTLTGTTFTIPTGLTIVTNPTANLVYNETSSIRKYVAITSYNSTTGVLVVTSTITMLGGSSFKIWNAISANTKGYNIMNSVGLGKYALSSVGSNTQGNTCIGIAALPGSGNNGYNGYDFLLGNYNTAIGNQAGVGVSGVSSNNTFIGANANVSGGGPGVVFSGTTVIGSNSYVSSGSTSLGAGNQANGLNTLCLGTGNIASHANSVLIGNTLSSTSDNQIILGNNTQTTVINGNLTLGGSLTLSPTSDVSLGKLTLSGDLTLGSASKFLVKGIFYPYECFSTIIETSYVLPTTPLYGVYKVRSTSTVTQTLTFPTPSAIYENLTIRLCRVLPSDYGAWYNNTSTIINFNGGAQQGLLTTTQFSASFICLLGFGAYNWYFASVN